MRRSHAGLLLLAALPLGAAEVKSPAWYYQQLTDSKILYNIDVKPAANPADEYTCTSRGMGIARIRSGNRWTLGLPPRHPDSGKLAAEAEKFFDRKQYAEAAKRYRQMLELDPNDIIAHLLYGDTFFYTQDYAGALAEYRKALAVDATNPAPSFFSVNALMRLDQADEARAAVVTALSYDPVYASLNKVLDTQPDAFGLRPQTRPRFSPPRGYLGKPDREGITVYGGADEEWRTYAICKAVLRNEASARQAVIGDAEAVEASFEEERACVTAYLDGNLERTRAMLEKSGKPASDAAVRNAAPPLARHLLDVLDHDLFDGFVAFEILGQRCPIAASMYPEPLHRDVERYVARYVVVKK